MDVTFLSPSSIRLKSKNATFVVNPVGIKKQEAEAALVFDNSLKAKDLVIDPTFVIINGPGDYELKGVKFSGFGRPNLIAYQGKIDGVDVCITKTSLIAKTKELEEHDVVIIEADELIDQAPIASIGAKVILLYGVKAQDQAKSLGKDPVSTNKFSFTKDKLPEELQIILLS